MYPDFISPGALKTEDEHRRDICAVGRWIHDRGYVASTDGNISAAVRSSPHTYFAYGALQRHDDARRFGELDLRCYQRPAKSFVRIGHAPTGLPAASGHKRRMPRAPPVATGYAAAGIPLNKALLCELVLSLGMRPRRSIRYPGNIGTGGPHRAAGRRLRCDPDGQSRSGDLRPGFAQGILPNGNYRALRARGACNADVRQTGVIVRM